MTSTAASENWPDLISMLLARQPLTADQTGWAMEQIMAGLATPAQVAGFIVALRAKGETAQEIGGLVRTMLSIAEPLPLAEELRAAAVDTCGTGGDRSNTVNLSTMAAIVTAGAGVTVVKHGNRAASSASGSADVLAELGVVIDLPPAGVEACLAAAGIAFCFAPVFHPAIRHVGSTRKELGVQTAFNILGPLANPGRPGAQTIGVADARLAPIVADVLADRGTRGLVFRGDDGLDELTTATASTVWVVNAPTPAAAGSGGSGRPGEPGGPTGAGGAEIGAEIGAGVRSQVRRDRFDPRDLGITPPDATALRGADATYNAAVVHTVLGGEIGPVRDAVLLAAAAALVSAAGPTDAPVTEQIAAQLGRAAESIDSGAAAETLRRWAEASQQAARARG
ncbi:anthranilate phosphoribosyltransferase [Parafrankia irregularis]|uniref:Anthranilate phosphoribosyltransferase n=1 Tax=Parafrankia irregularis TaxID=795642 RepID=A0A0S4QYF7_9ACTN|nr:MULTISPECIES: anthranilate phosphoribosyltransferase [Parafrankia]MBE3206353.1 anthranilate phosphoribosyltransferase [Parafrankia sp. CH37]CUU60082.1 anthranilate phosphoribosyltransferase [Parafrankia irregularis]